MKVWRCGNKTTITDDEVITMWSGLNKEEECEFLYEFDIEEIKREGDRVTIKGKVRKDGNNDQ